MSTKFILLAVTLALATGCAHRATTFPDAPGGARELAERPMHGPKHATVPLYRPQAGADKIYVEADAGDGVARMWLLDTGASISVITAEVAEAAGISVIDTDGEIVGMAGSTPWRRASLDEVRIGPYRVPDIEVAVDVPGVPDHAGLVPLAGILGNNVWAHFSMAIDYPADTLELARPGDLEVPETAQAMFFNGEHLATGALLEVDQDTARSWGLEPPATVGSVTQAVLLEIDTGARGLVISGQSGAGLEEWATEGEEPIFGIGAGDDLPASNFMRRTRRVPVAAVVAGGARVEAPINATWINYDGRTINLGPAGMPGLLGDSVLGDYRVVLDYVGQRFALVESTSKPRSRDIHQWALDQLRFDRSVEALHSRAELLAWLDRTDDARDLLGKRLDADPTDSHAAVVLARIERHGGDVASANARLAALDPAVLVDEGELVTTVNALWLSSRTAEALDLANRAVAVRPVSADAWVGLSDASRATGDLTTARRALRDANRLDENPDGHLLRRAWIASLEGDRNATLAHVRRLLQIYPSGGVATWFYAQEVSTDPGQRATFDRDVDDARARVHPSDAPLDFQAAAWRLLGESERALDVVADGLERDCSHAEDPSAGDNCTAWYSAMGGTDLDAAVRLIDGALAENPNRAEFLDTKAMVHEARGELDLARAAARAAASLVPDDIYLLWQVGRLDAAAAGG